jgi:hypothetical protein
MTENRKFLIPLSELIDRLTVDQIKLLLNKDDSNKSIKKEMQKMTHDIDQIINDKKIKLDSEIIRMIIILSQINLHIWNLKDKMEKDTNNYNKNLKLAHQINGIRNQIKNKILEKTNDLNQSSKRSNFNTDELEGWDYDLTGI